MVGFLFVVSLYSLETNPLPGWPNPSASVSMVVSGIAVRLDWMCLSLTLQTAELVAVPTAHSHLRGRLRLDLTPCHIRSLYQC